MPEQLVIFDEQSLLQLLTAYYDGLIPLDAKLLQVGTSQFLQRWVGMWIESDQWPESEAITGAAEGLEPLHLRYEGRRIMQWSKKAGDEIDWGFEGEDFEVPK